MNLDKHVDRSSFVTNDFFHAPVGGVLEHYWVNSDGFGVWINNKAPLFIRRDSNHGDPIMCFANLKQAPYDVTFDYTTAPDAKIWATIFVGQNVKQVYNELRKIKKIPLPATIPDERMFTYPIWSTWAKFFTEINTEKVLQYAKGIKSYGFPNSQLEIDDKWEAHYGDFTFDTKKFPNPKSLVEELHKEGFRVTFWVYPFVNHDSDAFNLSAPYLVKDSNKKDAKPIDIKWWDGRGSVVDFSNKTAQDWFVSRLEKLKKDVGMDSFKFDAGELNWYENKAHWSDEEVRRYPNLATRDYVQTVSRLGSMIEVRSSFQSQASPIFVRMLDKNSDWSFNDGLASLIPTALTMGLAGYSFIMPDMIGGNAYGNSKPDRELFIRWLQANVFMPNMQFSIPPWDYDEATVNISKKLVDLHVEYAPKIIALAKHFAQSGEPIMRPLWWADPDDAGTFNVGDQFLLGDDLLVAPVVEKGKVERQVYLPKGTWVDQNGKQHKGPARINVAAPLEVLPYFKLVK